MRILAQIVFLFYFFAPISVHAQSKYAADTIIYSLNYGISKQLPQISKDSTQAEIIARAIENECYVAIASNFGNLPNLNNKDIQYAQSAVFTPCDFLFLSNVRRAEATTNTEMILVVDVDLGLLRELHSFGVVKNLKDRRKDVYDVIRVEK